jgi:type I restriction enzyme, S subunit
VTGGRYKAYLEHCESRAEWMGEIPSHWMTVPFKHELVEKKRTSNPALNCGAISFGNVVYKNDDSIPPETKAAYQEVLAGEFLINPLNLNYDLKSLRTGLSSIDVVVSTGYIVLNSRPSLDKKFLRWLLFHFDVSHMKTLGSGVRQTINYTDIGNSFFSYPPLPEQTKIAEFLDYETGKIDALIEKQQQLIALLKEKRQAVISHAVTKGLNPDAPMKDSGVEWLGEVPAHWEVMQIKNLAAIISKGTTPSTIGKDMSHAGIRFIKGENVGKGLAVSKSPEFYISEATDKLLDRSRLRRGDVLVIIAGATTGLCSVVEADILPANTNQAVSFIRPLLPEHSHLIARWLSAEFAQRMIWMDAVQAAQPNLSMENLGNIPIVVPPVAELVEMLNQVNTRNRQLDQVIEQAHSMSESLQERRTALISAAVTGKIDVREFEVPESDRLAAQPKLRIVADRRRYEQQCHGNCFSE